MLFLSPYPMVLVVLKYTWIYVAFTTLYYILLFEVGQVCGTEAW